MPKTGNKELRAFNPSRSDPKTFTSVLTRRIRRTIAVTFATVAGAYFVAVSTLVVIMLLPLLVVRVLKYEVSRDG